MCGLTLNWLEQMKKCLFYLSILTGIISVAVSFGSDIAMLVTCCLLMSACIYLVPTKLEGLVEWVRIVCISVSFLVNTYYLCSKLSNYYGISHSRVYTCAIFAIFIGYIFIVISSYLSKKMKV